MIIKRLVKLIASFFLLINLTSCSKELIHHGYSYEPDDLKSIYISRSSTEDVINTMGSPTTFSLFGEKTFYYISVKYQQVAFFDPKIMKQDVIAITFDEQNIVKEINIYDLSKAKKITFIEKKTDIPGKKVGALEQIWGNVGRFNTASTNKPGN